MAIEIGCACSTGNGNTGTPNCTTLLGVAKGFGLQNTVANDGTVNRINLSVASITNEFSGMLTNDDRSKRMFPVKGLENYTAPNDGIQYETSSSGRKEALREGIQSFNGEIWNVTPQFVAKLKQSKCQNNGTWIYSKVGVQGIRKLDTTSGNYYWYPIPIDAFAPEYMPQTDGAVAKAMIAFDYEQTVSVGELWMLTWADLNTTYEEMVGLLDVNYKVIDAPVDGGTTTSVGYRLNTDYGDGLDNTTTQNVDDLVAASFTAKNVTTGLAITITSVTEVIDNKYTFVLPSQTTADVVRISLVTTTGFEGSVTYVQPA